jgi:hypothetical protein
MKNAQIKEPSVLVFFLEKDGGIKGLRGSWLFQNHKRIGSFHERTFGLKSEFFSQFFFRTEVLYQNQFF